ncbi:hypothetical protein FGE12_23335 [Aggregicoccus sp. 17bor-14]|uniref:hypothetical protein n=1 Tax=Myxococcaceae TaxID=31 RepID=UPI00129C50C5|nr:MULTISPECIES: hypothetical protein [Myxococcaceae]MBF5045358.1 hypothetical protein [Simulacricoccus sp. 17bor-14]MRI91100.1 hypothetical protein [Aggregicoccus sp. 17bor-14]
MRRLILTAALCLATPLALAGEGTKPHASAKAAESCGQHMADEAKYPEQLSRTLTQVADMYEAHAKWVGTGDAASKAEHDKLVQLAQEHRDLAQSSRKMADSMKASSDLAAAPHKGPPPAELTRAMQNMLAEMHTFAQMLDRGVREGQHDLQAMKGPKAGGSAQQGTGGSGAPAKDMH